MEVRGKRKDRPTLADLERIVEAVGRRYGDNLEVKGSSETKGTLDRFTIRAKESGAPGNKADRVWRERQGLPPVRYGNRDGHSAPGARRGPNNWGPGHRLTSACWHAHRDVLRAVFAEFPRISILTSMARYDGPDGFEATFPGTAGRNIGSMMVPAYMPDLCDCSADVRADGHSFSVTMRQSDILACPFVIMVPEHYRPDGSCRCDDPSHRATMAEWGYSPADFAV